MNVLVINNTEEKRWNRYKKDFIQIAKRCEALLRLAETSSVSVIFVDASTIHEINRMYRKVDRSTDVISFALHDTQETYDMPEGSEELGDIFINIQAIVEQAHSYQHSMRREVCFLFTHGLLHLCGYDHTTKEEETEMFALQDVILDEIVPKKKHC